jgi:uncharacterized protein YhdP
VAGAVPGRRGNEVSSNVLFPERITLRTPSLTFAGQSWNNVSLVSQPDAGGSKVEAQGVKSTPP